MARIRRRPAARIYPGEQNERRPDACAHNASGRYTYVPSRHLTDAVTSAELRRKLLAEISGAIDHEGYCRLSITDLAIRLESTRLVISLQIAALKYAGVICRTQDADGRHVTIVVVGGAADPDAPMGSESTEGYLDPAAL